MLRWVSVSSIWLYSACLATAASVALSPVIDLGYAKIQGAFNATDDVTEFLGIRFAAPPVGKLRFQAPRKPLQQQGIQVADVEAPECPQGTIGIEANNPFQGLTRRAMNTTEIEDCLFLNVHVSGKITPGANMPVVFWIHGGGYADGGAVGFDGSDLIREAGGGIVAVEVQYRLGLFGTLSLVPHVLLLFIDSIEGFIPGQEIKKNGALNLGLLDQNAALEWVQSFIHLFGGNPAHVTIWGESAGAGSVLHHIVAHRGNTQPPLFLQSMSSSLAVLNEYDFDDPIPEFLFSEVARLSGCSNATNVFDCLIDVPASTLENVNNEILTSGFFGTFLFIPVVDGDFIVERPMATLERGTVNGHGLLAVTNQFEGTIFVSPTLAANLTLAQYVAQLVPQFNSTQVQTVVNLYENAFDGTLNQVITMMTDSIFVCPTHIMMSAFPKNSRKGEFGIPPGTHGSDVVYYFPGNSTPPFANPQFDASFAGAFLGFAKFGDPNRHPVSTIITPEWPLFTAERPTEMLFNRTESFQPEINTFETDPGLLSRCAVWKELTPFIPQ
ncbi:cephalosporin esterase [Schizopora paradoxa]|uniref:Carboxylic ester hydrolase n=1 Tax=Schizopora paradoxa TaxID=27342 RepID=A0A0H2S9B1_9AGAM|nr:cephalosporin esterase [Schizopora paradoxa]